MKSLYILLLSLACSTAVLAQTSDTETIGEESIIEDVLSEQILADETFSEEMTDEGALDEEIVDLNSVPQDVLAQIQQDCSALAQNEGIEAALTAEFVEICVIDSVATDLAIGEEDDGTETEIFSEEYAEVSEDDSTEIIAE